MIKCIVFSRVSSQQQDLKSQEETVMKAAYEKGYRDKEIIKISYKESAVKLSEEERLGIKEMIQAIEDNDSIECVIVFELSRIARRPDIVYKIRDLFIERKIQLISLKPYMELLNPDKTPNSLSLMFFSFIVGWTETEIYLKNERTLRGRMRNREVGKAWNGACSFGYYIDKDKYYQIDEEKADIVREIFLTYSQGHKSMGLLQKEINERGYSGANVRHILNSRNYLGEKNYPRIISDEVFEQCQEMMSQNRCQPKSIQRHVYYAKGILYDKNGREFTCQAPTASYRSMELGISISINLIDSLLWSLAKQRRVFSSSLSEDKQKKKLNKKTKELDEKISNAEKEIKMNEEKIQKTEERLIYGKLTEEKAKDIENYLEKSNNLMKKNLTKWREERSEYDKLLKSFTKLIDLDLDNIEDDARKREIIHEEIKKVTVDRISKGEVEVDVSFDGDDHNKYELFTKRRKCYLLGIEVDFNYKMRFDNSNKTRQERIRRWRERWREKNNEENIEENIEEKIEETIKKNIEEKKVTKEMNKERKKSSHSFPGKEKLEEMREERRRERILKDIFINNKR